MENKFSLGDVVKLRSNSLEMTVIMCSADTLGVVWWNSDTKKVDYQELPSCAFILVSKNR